MNKTITFILILGIIFYFGFLIYQDYQGQKQNQFDQRALIIGGLNYDPFNGIYGHQGKLYSVPFNSLSIGQQILIKAEVEGRIK